VHFRWKLLPIRWKIALIFLATGFAGLGICRLIAELFFGGEKGFMEMKYGSAIVFTFVFIWLVSILALLPMNLAKDQKRVPLSAMKRYPWWKWLLFFPLLIFHAAPLVPEIEGTAYVPRWISYPLIGIALLLAAFILIVLVTIGVHQLFGWA
jgi:hypothetical protein